MLNKTINYTDYNDKAQKVECHFNLTRAEFTRLDAKYGGFSKALQKYISDKDTASMLAFYEDLILSSYGIKASDGEFYKVDENGKKLSTKFAQTLAYDTLLDELLFEEGASVNFIKGILPKDLADKIDSKEVQKEAAKLIEEIK